MRVRSGESRVFVGLLLLAGLLIVSVAGWMLYSSIQDEGREEFPTMGSSAVIESPTGHAYQYVAAPNISWETARMEASKRNSKSRPGYLATMDNRAEFDFVMQHVFPEDTDVTYLGGRQTAPGEWRWVTGPDAAAEGGKGVLFWMGYEGGFAPQGRFATWMFSAFQHGGKWDVSKVCCVTLFSYRRRMFSSSLGTGDTDEGVAGYLVEYSR